MWLFNCLNIFVLLVVVFSAKLPQQFTKCPKNDDLDSCLPGAIENAIVAMSAGFPELGILPVEPIEIPALTIGAGSGAVHLQQNYHDAQLIGISKIKVPKAHMDFDKKILTFSSAVPKIEMKAQYDVNGKVLVLPVYGKGDSLLQLFDVIVLHTIEFEETAKNGKTFYKVKNYVTDLSCKNAHYDFQNLFDGNKELGDNILTVINDNWEEIFNDVKEGYEKAFAAIFRTLAERVFNRIPIDQIFN